MNLIEILLKKNFVFETTCVDKLVEHCFLELIYADIVMVASA